MQKPPTQVTILVQQVTCATELFHTLTRDEFASVSVAGHRETYPVKSTAFRHYLRRLFLRLMRKAPSTSAINDAMNMCAAIAADGPEYNVYLRVGEINRELWLDLGDPDWAAVRITSDGWQVVPDPPIRFRRPLAALPLPMPSPGGDLRRDLFPLLNLEKDDDYCLVLSWLCAALRSRGPYPVLAIHGEQGSAKSTLCRMLRGLIDPYKSPLRTVPRDERDLQIAANNSHVIAIDNASRIEPWLSDSFCRLATGGGLSTRTLFTDCEETIFDAMRPIVLNGIEDIATRGDLADRSIVLYLPQISVEARQQEHELWANFREAQPKILGALLDAMSGGLRKFEMGFKLAETPRMADFAYWAVALEQPLGFHRGTFLDTYRRNRADATAVVLETPIALAVTKFITDRKTWEGTAKELLDELRTCGYLTERDSKYNPRTFAGALRRLAPALRTIGVNLRQGRREAHTGRRLVELVYSEVAVTP